MRRQTNSATPRKCCSLEGRDIEDAVAEGAEGDGGVADIGVVGEHDFEDGDVIDDRGGDGGD